MEKGKDLIVITGATGKQGGATARELLAEGHKVRAVTRHPESEAAQGLAAKGAEIVQGDLDDAASLERALQGAWGTFAVQNTWEAGVEMEEEQGKRYAEVARRAGVQHYVYTSVASAQRNTGIPHFDNKWRVENRVRELGFPSWTIIRPVFFMDNLLSPWFKPGIDAGTFAMGMKPETKLQMIAVSDVGKYGALAFNRHEQLRGAEIDIAGDALTGPEAAETLTRVIGRPIAFVPVPLDEVRKFSEDYAIMLDWFDRVGYDSDIAGNAAKYGIPATPFETWARSVSWA